MLFYTFCSKNRNEIVKFLIIVQKKHRRKRVKISSIICRVENTPFTSVSKEGVVIFYYSYSNSTVPVGFGVKS